MKQKRPVRILIVLFVLLVLTLAGCQKTKGPKEAVDEYLKKAQSDPYSMTILIASMKSEYRSQIEDLMKEFEYEILNEEEVDDTENGTERKGYWVTFTGYDIGKYFKDYLANYWTDALTLLGRDHSYEELNDMMENDPDRFNELFRAANLEVFTKYMNACREAGKTYHTEEGQYGIIVMKYRDSKEWVTNPLGIGDHLDWITNGVYTAWQDYSKSVSQ